MAKQSTLEWLSDPKHFAAHMKRQAIDAEILTKKGKPFKHGGARKGAGRKPSPHKMLKVAITLRTDQKDYLDKIEVENRSTIIRQLLDQWIASQK